MPSGSNFQPLGDGFHRVAGLRRSAITGRYHAADRPPSSIPAPDGEAETRDWHPDEQPDVDKGVNDFTPEQADALQEYINTLAAMLDLNHWDIFLTHASAKDDCNASIHPVYGRHVAALSVNKGWFSYSREVQRNTILHELLHVVHNRQTEVIRTTSQVNAVWTTFERETELMVDGLANALERFFPLPEYLSSVTTVSKS